MLHTYAFHTIVLLHIVFVFPIFARTFCHGYCLHDQFTSATCAKMMNTSELAALLTALCVGITTQAPYPNINIQIEDSKFIMIQIKVPCTGRICGEVQPSLEIAANATTPQAPASNLFDNKDGIHREEIKSYSEDAVEVPFMPCAGNCGEVQPSLNIAAKASTPAPVTQIFDKNVGIGVKSSSEDAAAAVRTFSGPQISDEADKGDSGETQSIPSSFDDLGDLGLRSPIVDVPDICQGEETVGDDGICRKVVSRPSEAWIEYLAQFFHYSWDEHH